MSRKNGWLFEGILISALVFAVAFIVHGIAGLSSASKGTWFTALSMNRYKYKKAQQDIDVLASSARLHDAQNRPLVGSNFDPLKGRYL